MAIEILNCSQLVTASSYVHVFYTPLDGEKVNPIEFLADVPPDPKCVARLVWNATISSARNGTHLWSIANTGVMPHGMADDMLLQQTGDGVKKMAVIFENNSAVDYFFSSHIELEKS